MDRIKRAFALLLEPLARRLDRTALYPGRVVAQAADGSIEVQLDDGRWPSMTKVPLRTPFPETTVEVQPGARVLVGWESGSPSAPYASLWESGTLVRTNVGGTDPVSLSSKVDALFDAFVNAPPGTQDGGAAIQAAVKAVWETMPNGTGATKLRSS